MLDFAFESMNKYGIEKLKEMVDNNNSEATNSVVLNETSAEETNTTDTEESSENTVAEENANNVEE